MDESEPLQEFDDEMALDMDPTCKPTYNAWPGWSKENAIVLNGELIAVQKESDILTIYEAPEGKISEVVD